MFLPRSTFQIVAICITLFSCSALFLSFHASENVPSRTYVYPSNPDRLSLKSVTHVKPKLVIDEPIDDPIWAILNRTLGFQKIYAISMPHRTDKRDYLALMGLVSDLDIEFVDGVNGSEIHPKALPAYWKGTKAAGDYGCWRAHLNVYRHMIQHNIESALVIEDDVDWDVLVRSQMVDFARGVRAIQNATLPIQSPYGDNWDLLALGHTGANNKPNKIQKYWVTDDDPTVIAESRRTWDRKPDLSTDKLAGEHTRIVMEMSKFTATTAYGVSLRGAARFLYDQSLLPNADAIDMAMLALCRHDVYSSPFCFGSYPMIFGRYRAIGPQDKDSDRRATSNEADAGSGGYQDNTERLEPESEFMVFPVSLNMGRLMRGEWVLPAVDPETDLMKELDLRTFLFHKGKEVVVKPEEYAEYQAVVAMHGKEKQDRMLQAGQEGVETENKTTKRKSVA